MNFKRRKDHSYLQTGIGTIAALAAGFSIAAVPEHQSAALMSAHTEFTDRLIVKYRDSISASKDVQFAPAISKQRLAILLRVGQQHGLNLQALHTIGTGAHVIALGKHLPAEQASAIADQILMRDASVEYAEADRLMHPALTPNDPRYAEQWHYFESAGGIRAPAAWDKSTGTGVRIAVLDTGYRPHADLAANLLPGYDFISSLSVANDGNGRDSDARDPGDWAFVGECGNGQPTQNQYSSWHGTHVTGTIAARTNNSSGVAGVAYGARIVPARVLGKCGGYTSDIADAIIWSSGGSVAGVPANANPARVLNLSLAGIGRCSSTMQAAINSARSRGAVIVVAAGNSNVDTTYTTPTNCPGVIAVAAVNRSGGKAWYSNYGMEVDLAAPGGDTSVPANGILSTLNSGLTTPGSDTYAFYQGTSMATPHVAAVAAMMLSRNPSLTPDQIESRLKNTLRPFPASCPGCGTGIVDALAAVNAAGGGTTVNETEPNDTMGTAQAIGTSGTTVNATMSSSTNNDYYVVQLPAGRTLTATLTPNSTSDYDLHVYNSAGTLIGRSENSKGAIDSVSVTNTGSSTSARYVRVFYYSGGTGSTYGKYTLKLSW